MGLWLHVPHLNKHIQIRNVPDALHRRLKQRAAEKGLSLSDYLREEMRRLAALPSREEWVRRVRSREPWGISTEEIVENIHAAREEREKDLDNAMDAILHK